MDSVKIRELEEKSLVNPEDTFVLEDNTGTLQAPVSALQASMQDSLFLTCVDDMRNLSFNAGDVVETLGYHTAGDGGMATYIIVDAPQELDNGITIISLHTSDTLKAHLMYDKYVSPLQAGAYGSGTSDDTDTIANLLSLKIPVRFPKQKFFASISLSGDDIIDFNGATIIYDGTVITVQNSDLISNLDISDVNLESKKGSVIVVSSDVTSMSLHNCTMTRSNNLPLLAINSDTNISLSNCLLIDNYTEIGNPVISTSNKMTQGNSIIIDSCIFNNSKSTYIDSYGKLIVNNCNFSSSGYSRYAITTHSGGQICNCFFTGAPAIDADGNNAVSLTDISNYNTAFMVKLGDECMITMDGAIVFGSNSKDDSVLKEYIVDGSSGKGTIQLNGQVVYDRQDMLRRFHYGNPYNVIGDIWAGDQRDISFTNSSNITVFSYCNNCNEKGDMLEVNGDATGIIDIANSSLKSIAITEYYDNRYTVYKYRYGRVNAAIKISSQYPVKRLDNGVDGQVFVLYGDGVHIVCGSGNNCIYDGDNSEIVLSLNIPVIIRYHNGFWTRMK